MLATELPADFLERRSRDLARKDVDAPVGAQLEFRVAHLGGIEVLADLPPIDWIASGTAKGSGTTLAA